MSFVHEDPDWDDLVLRVATARGIDPALVEKDYWVTHTLWALQDCGLELWFKGGTSLSKGFGLIERFSEDLDLRVEGAGGTPLPPVPNWKSVSKAAVGARRERFEALSAAIRVPGGDTTLDRLAGDDLWRAASFRVRYPARQIGRLSGILRPFVLLEVGDARVTPFVPKDISSWIHAELEQLGLAGEYADNRPRGLRCVHPLVTLVEKLDAITRRWTRAEVEAGVFVRHYEDAARIIGARAGLPGLDGYTSPRELVEEMLSQRQIRAVPRADDAALAPAGGGRWDEVRDAHETIGPLFWGPRTSLDEACSTVRDWVGREMAGAP